MAFSTSAAPDADASDPPVDTSIDLPVELLATMPAETADGLTQFAEVPTVQEITPNIDDAFVSDVGAVDAVAQAADDIWDDLG